MTTVSRDSWNAKRAALLDAYRRGDANALVGDPIGMFGQPKKYYPSTSEGAIASMLADQAYPPIVSIFVSDFIKAEFKPETEAFEGTLTYVKNGVSKTRRTTVREFSKDADLHWNAYNVSVSWNNVTSPTPGFVRSFYAPTPDSPLVPVSKGRKRGPTLTRRIGLSKGKLINEKSGGVKKFYMRFNGADDMNKFASEVHTAIDEAYKLARQPLPDVEMHIQTRAELSYYTTNVNRATAYAYANGQSTKPNVVPPTSATKFDSRKLYGVAIVGPTGYGAGSRSGYSAPPPPSRPTYVPPTPPSYVPPTPPTTPPSGPASSSGAAADISPEEFFASYGFDYGLVLAAGASFKPSSSMTLNKSKLEILARNLLAAHDQTDGESPEAKNIAAAFEEVVKLKSLLG